MTYIPIYVGVHKEPTTGMLSNDFCLGSVFFYNETGKYDVIEKHNRTGATNKYAPNIYYNRPASVNKIIGVGIDRPNNTISVYVEGKLIYTFSPSLFNLDSDEGKCYPSLYFSIDNKKKIVGKANFGKSVLMYTPEGYISTFKAHNLNIIKYTYNYPENLTNTYNNWYTGDGIMKLSTTNLNGCNINGTELVLDKNHDSYIYNPLPIPSKFNSFYELIVRNGILKNGYLGIPISIGIATYDELTTPGSGDLINIPLYHYRQTMYTYLQRKAGSAPVNKYISDVLTSIPNKEGKYISVSINPNDNVITIWVDKIKFCEYQITEFDLSESDKYYFYIKSDTIILNSMNIDINFGQNQITSITDNVFKMNIPTEHISLWYYYNKMIFKVFPYPQEVVGEVIVTSPKTMHTKSIIGTVNVSTVIDPNSSKFGPGLNRLMNTFNMIDDTTEHNIDSIAKDKHYLNNLIADNNNGYFLDDPHNTLNYK